MLPWFCQLVRLDVARVTVLYQGYISAFIHFAVIHHPGSISAFMPTIRGGDIHGATVVLQADRVKFENCLDFFLLLHFLSLPYYSSWFSILFLHLIFFVFLPSSFLITQVRDCKLSSLLDLALEKDYVRSTIAAYMNHLIDMGVAGFRIDAAKHMWPGDIRAFLDKLHDLNTQWFSAGTKPFIYQEVFSMFFSFCLSVCCVLCLLFLLPYTWGMEVMTCACSYTSGKTELVSPVGQR